MNKHSPGPWQSRGMLWRREEEAAPYYKEVVDARGLRVGEVWVGIDGHADQEEGLANLRLVLKATELLALVQEILNWQCLDGISGECWLERGNPVLAVQALLKEIAGKEETGGD